LKRKIFLHDVKNLSLDEAFEKFINFKIAMSKSKYTIAYYKERYAYFRDFLKSYKNITITSGIYDECVTDYILHVRRKSPNISNNTINNHLRAIRAILYYFMEKGFLEPFHISLITVKQTPKEGYTREEQEKLIRKPDMKKCTFSEYRNWVIVCHVLASGNRSRTIRYIQVKHIDLNERIITLTEVKNNDGYEMPISDEYYPILKEYLEIRNGEPDDYLFCNQFGKQLTAGGLRSVLYKYNKNHDVEKTSIHIFRNTFAKNWLLEGGSAKKLQHALGHKNSHMVDEYARLYGRELREEFSKYTPLAKLKEELSGNKKIKMKKATS